MKLLHVPLEVYESYRTGVKGNDKTSYDQAIRKLTRNVLLVKDAAREQPELIKKSLLSTTYCYGNLHIKVRFNKVVKVVNHKGEPTKWRFPKRKYQEFTKLLEITDGKISKVTYK